MTIEDFGDFGAMIKETGYKCIWFDEEKKQVSAIFKEEVLQKYEYKPCGGSFAK